MKIHPAYAQRANLQVTFLIHQDRESRCLLEVLQRHCWTSDRSSSIPTQFIASNSNLQYTMIVFRTKNQFLAAVKSNDRDFKYPTLTNAEYSKLLELISSYPPKGQRRGNMSPKRLVEKKTEYEALVLAFGFALGGSWKSFLDHYSHQNKELILIGDKKLLSVENMYVLFLGNFEASHLTQEHFDTCAQRFCLEYAVTKRTLKLLIAKHTTLPFPIEPSSSTAVVATIDSSNNQATIVGSSGDVFANMLQGVSNVTFINNQHVNNIGSQTINNTQAPVDKERYHHVDNCLEYTKCLFDFGRSHHVDRSFYSGSKMCFLYQIRLLFVVVIYM